MTRPHWPAAIDPVVERARFLPGPEDFWESAEKVVASGLPDDTMQYLATVGLAELVTWVHKIDRDASKPCAGELVARSQHPEVFPDDE